MSSFVQQVESYLLAFVASLLGISSLLLLFDKTGFLQLQYEGDEKVVVIGSVSPLLLVTLLFPLEADVAFFSTDGGVPFSRRIDAFLSFPSCLPSSPSSPLSLLQVLPSSFCIPCHSLHPPNLDQSYSDNSYRR